MFPLCWIIKRTSYGDIFCQSYFANSDSEDKTFNSGPGAAQLKLTEESREKAFDWLREAEEKVLAKTKITDKDIESHYTSDVLEGKQTLTVITSLPQQQQ